MSMDQIDIVRVLLRDREKMFAYIWSIVRDAHIADDVFQDVSLLAIEHRQEINSEEHLCGWLRRASRLKALEALRARKRMPSMLSEEAMSLLEAHWQEYDGHSASDVVDSLRACMARLTPYARQVIKLRYVDGMGGEEVAATLNRKLDTVYKSLSRIHRSLRDCMERHSAASPAVVEQQTA